MVEIGLNMGPNELYLYKNELEMTLKFKNNVSKKEYEFTVEDLDDTMMYYHFENVQLPIGLSDGEYSYELYDADNKLVAQGLAQIGSYVPENTKKYEKNNSYKQYNG